jgi:hypothetical protein
VTKADTFRQPWVVVAPDGVHWLGEADGETQAWRYALGWPDTAEVEDAKSKGWYAAPATLKWKRP